MEGQRVEKKPEGKKKIWVIAGAAAAVVLCAYLGLCAWVGSQSTIFPHVSVAGLDVSGMTAEQAGAFLEKTLSEQGGQAVVEVTYGDWTGTVTAEDLDNISCQESAAQAQRVGREHFLTQGAAYAAHLFSVSADLPFYLTGVEPQALLKLAEQAEQVVGDTTESTYEVSGGQLVMTKGRTGVHMDGSALWADLQAAFEGEDGVFAEKFGQGKDGAVVRQIQLPVTETAPQEPDFDAIRAAVATEPQDAKMDPETFTITDHVMGVDVDVQTLKAAYESAGEGEEFSVPLILTEPKETKESLESKLFADVLGEASTNLIGTASRQFNVKLAASAVNGAIILPGEVFSFNGLTGSRSAAMGYKTATVYNNGKTVQEVGGGVCQTSSTIYYAFLHTNLEVVERVNHGYRSDYVPDGFDATVYYPVTDFKFRNSTDYPIKVLIYSEWRNGREVMVSKILGTNVDGVYAVPSSTTFDWVYPTTVYQPDETIPQGTTKVDTVQNPYTGVKARTYRSIYDRDGNLIETQDMGLSVYKMRPKTILYNPADGDPSTWENGVPPTPVTTEPDPGTTEPVPTDPGATGPVPADPGLPDPGAVETEPENTQPDDPVSQDIPVD